MHTFIHGKYRNTLAKLSLLSLSAVSVLGYTPSVARAASLVNAKDTLTTLNTNSTANHTIVFTLPSDASLSSYSDSLDHIVVDFPDDFTTSEANTWQTSDFSLNDGVSRTISAVGESVTCQFGDVAIVRINPTSDSFTVRLCSGFSFGENQGATVTFTIYGTSTTGTGTLTNPSSAGVQTVGISTRAWVMALDTYRLDSTQIALPIISDDSVNITATVDPTLTFTISDTTVGFGTLTTANARYARGDLSGSAANNSSAHTLEVATNATSGYVISYKGATLTSLASSDDTITAATISGDADGTAGSEQFAISLTGTSGATVVSDYNQGSSNWKFVPNTTTTVVSNDAPTGTANIKVRYIANIGSTTEAGAYSTDIYYIATGTF